MTDKPILFSAPMIQAILAGRKTMTRRVLKPQPSKPFNAIFNYDDGWFTGDGLDGARIEKLPVKYKVGDTLWVREAWRADSSHNRIKPSNLEQETVQLSFEATEPFGQNGKLRPSMFMPRWASRITLEVTGVKVERLNSISEEDALAEGAWHWNETHDVARVNDNAREAFCHLWESINGENSWSANPWVVAYSFKVVKP